MTKSVVELRPLSGALGAEVIGVSMTEPPDDAIYRTLRDAWLQYQILLFREQQITVQQQIAFSRSFGPLYAPKTGKNIHPDHPEILVFSNIKVDGEYIGQSPARTGEGWHSDFFYMREPANGSMLRAEQAPPTGGETWFANMYMAYDSLSEATQHQIDGLQTTYSQVKSYTLLASTRMPLSEEEKRHLPDVTHPLARTHPETGRKALFAGMRGSLGATVDGMDEDASVAFLEDLRAFATLPQFTYCHWWRSGDVILWDNRCTMHRATMFDDSLGPRLCYRTTLAGEVPY